MFIRLGDNALFLPSQNIKENQKAPGSIPFLQISDVIVAYGKIGKGQGAGKQEKWWAFLQWKTEFWKPKFKKKNQSGYLLHNVRKKIVNSRQSFDYMDVNSLYSNQDNRVERRLV